MYGIIVIILIYFIEKWYKQRKKEQLRESISQIIITVYSKDGSENADRECQLEAVARSAMFFFKMNRPELFNKWLDSYPVATGMYSNFEFAKPGYEENVEIYHYGFKTYNEIFEKLKKEKGL